MSIRGSMCEKLPAYWRGLLLPTRPKTIACTPTIPHKVTDVPSYDRGAGHPPTGS